MSPPSYADLGKSARDVFGKGFHFGLIKLDVKSKSSSGIELSSSGQFNVDSGKVRIRNIKIFYLVFKVTLTDVGLWKS